ncbi:PaaI family thioesterase [Nocardia sp. BMG111209]|uniref:PaaI family thioesterase n=1 Tax=Nocardia sp. BMG111209 TaxID=1160137 RepID=UPI00039C0993|nr:PaaI family thioesterase [Nocardia sp. BMG111209]
MPTGNEPASKIAAAQARLVEMAGTEIPDYEQIRRTVDTLVPFVNLAGIRMTELGPDSAVAEIPAEPDKLNHLGTVHAGALFLAAEVACAGAFSGAFAPRILQLRTFVLRDTRATFLRAARGRIRAHGTVSSPALADIVGRGTEEQFDLTGKALLRDDSGALVAKVDLQYFCWLAAA